MLEKLSAHAIYYRSRSDGPTGISNTAVEEVKTSRCGAVILQVRSFGTESHLTCAYEFGLPSGRR